MSKFRVLAKKCIDYRIEGEYKIYRPKHTPFVLKRKYTKEYHNVFEKMPVQKDKIIFDNYKGGGYGCNCKYVLKELLRRGIHADYVWVLRNPDDAKALPDGVRTVAYGSRQAMEEYATAKVWVNNFQMTYYLNRGLLKKPEQYYIQMWHGSFGIKKIEGDCGYLGENQPWLALAQKNAAYTDYWISNSSFETQVYREAFWGAEKILEYGHPRNDLFFGDTTEVVARVRDRYGLTDEKIVLYVPTFRDENRSKVTRPDVENLLGSLEKRFGGRWVFALRQHPRMVNGEAERLVMEQGQQGIRVCDVTAYPDIQELLAAADVVITDYSSAIFDFMLTERPGFLLAEDYEAYEDFRGLYYPLEEAPFPVARTQAQLFEQIECFDETGYRESVREFLGQKGSKEDGKAAERVALLIEEIIEDRLEVQND